MVTRWAEAGPVSPALDDAPAAPRDAWVGLGGNLGDARATVLAAFDALQDLPDTCIEARSALYRSAPVDAGGPDFVNAVARLKTTLAPMRLLRGLQAIEQRFGRERPYRNAPRTLDLDLLFYAGVTSDDAVLTLPHPRWKERAFVLRPLRDVWLDDAAGMDWPRLLDAVNDQRLDRMEQA